MGHRQYPNLIMDMDDSQERWCRDEMASSEVLRVFEHEEEVEVSHKDAQQLTHGTETITVKQSINVSEDTHYWANYGIFSSDPGQTYSGGFVAFIWDQFHNECPSFYSA